MVEASKQTLLAYLLAWLYNLQFGGPMLPIENNIPSFCYLSSQSLAELFVSPNQYTTAIGKVNIAIDASGGHMSGSHQQQNKITAPSGALAQNRVLLGAVVQLPHLLITIASVDLLRRHVCLWPQQQINGGANGRKDRQDWQQGVPEYAKHALKQ